MKSYKYRIYPNEKQKEMFAKHFGCARFIYNNALSHKTQVYNDSKKNLSYFDLTGEWIKGQKQKYPWLRDVYAQSLQMSLRNLDNAYTNFFHKRAKFPKFKKKSGKQTYQFYQGLKVFFEENKIYVPKIGKIKCVLHRKFSEKPRLATISLSSSGKYYICICVEENPQIISTTENQIGIDLGLISFVTTSEGEKFEAPKPLKKYLSKLQKLQKILSKKAKGSNQSKKLQLKINCLHEKIANIRHDFLHKISTKLARENQTICVETLSVKSMMENAVCNEISRAIADVSWTKFLSFLKYKCTDVRECGRFEPTTKLCNKCGYLAEDLSLKVRQWACENCQAEHDRDINAAINIRNFGLERSINPIKIGSCTL